MRTFDHLRWHLALALGGALLVERLHWQIAAGLIGLVAVDRFGAAAGKLRRRAAVRRPVDRTAVAGGPGPPRRAAVWRGAALVQALGADCPACRGVGCEGCAGTGLN